MKKEKGEINPPPHPREITQGKEMETTPYKHLHTHTCTLAYTHTLAPLLSPASSGEGRGAGMSPVSPR